MRFRSPFRRGTAPSRLTPMRALLLLGWGAAMVPRLVQGMTAAKFRVSVGDAQPYTALASLADRGMTLLLLLYCAGVVLARLRRLPDTGLGSLALLLLPWICLVSRDALEQTNPSWPTVVYPAVVVAVWVLQPRIEELRDVAALAVLTALVSVGLGFAVPDQGRFMGASGQAIIPSKVVLPFGVLVGPFTSGNTLGQFLAVSVPMLLILPRRRRWPALALVLFAILWTASRSSLTAAAAALLVAALITAVPAPVRAGLAGLFGLTAVTAMVVIPLMSWDDTAFTNRGFIWRGSLAAWRHNPVVGLGSTWYARVGGSTEEIASTAYHGHNLTVQMLVTGGWVLAALGVLLLVRAVVMSARWAGRGHHYLPAFMVALLISCTLEVSFGLVDRAYLVGVVTIPLAVLLLSPVPARVRGGAASPARAPAVRAGLRTP